MIGASAGEHPIRIGVNALYLIPGGVGGTEIYLRNLLSALSRIDASNDYFIFTNRETGAELVPQAPNFHHHAQHVRATNRPWRLIWEQTILPLVVRQLRLDCLFNPGFTAPALLSCPNITVFHDLQHKRHPEHFRWFDLPFWNFFLGLAVQHSERLLADSEATRADLRRFYRVPENKMEVVPLGVEEEFFRIGEQRNITDPMVLCVSTLHPHKNLERLIRVFAQLRDRHPDFLLVIAGLRGFHAGPVEALIDQLSLRNAVRLTGWIPREELYHLFRKARAFVYPSTFEGFGLPVLEAMAAGIPMACSSVEPLASLTSDAALHFAPDDDAGMLDALTSIVENESLRSELAGRGRIRAKQFHWDTCARRTLRAIRYAGA